MKLMVTFDAATLRATPARNAVSPARAPDDRSRPPIGILTDPDVMLTMRPNFFADHRVDRLLNQLYGDDHVGDDAVEHFLPVELAEIAKRRSGIVVDQNVRLWTGGEQRLLSLGRGDIGGDRDDFGAGRLVQFRSFGGEFFRVAAVDHDLAARFASALAQA